MQPAIELDLATLRENAAAWRRHAGVPLAAVVKADGYGWGLETVVDVLVDAVDAFCVADESEFRRLRQRTSRAAIILGDVSPERLPAILALGAQVTIDAAPALAEAARLASRAGVPLSVRVGVRPAVGWGGSRPEDIVALAPSLAAAEARVQLWSHLTDPAAEDEQAAAVFAVAASLRDAGVPHVDLEMSSTFPLARHGARGAAVRVGIGLFGATGGIAVPGIGCALRVDAPLARIESIATGTRLGYGSNRAERAGEVAVLRIGYADGFPPTLAGRRGIRSVGMQYTSIDAPLIAAMRRSTHSAYVTVVGSETDLDGFAADAGRTVHELVVTFGLAARAKRAPRGDQRPELPLVPPVPPGGD